MGFHIHARKRDGRDVFRLWSTERDSYATKEMTAAELRTYLLCRAIERVIDDHNTDRDSEFEQDLTRAIKSGTSTPVKRHMVGTLAPWAEEHDPRFSGGSKHAIAATIARVRNELKELLQKLG